MYVEPYDVLDEPEEPAPVATLLYVDPVELLDPYDEPDELEEPAPVATGLLYVDPDELKPDPVLVFWPTPVELDEEELDPPPYVFHPVWSVFNREVGLPGNVAWNQMREMSTKNILKHCTC